MKGVLTMGTLYYANGGIAAVYEDGVVYYDARRTSVLGTYENGSVYSGSMKYFVGSVSGSTIYSYRNPVGQIVGDSIYLGTNWLYSNRIGYFYGGDENGAAAAALLSGMFNGAGILNDHDDTTQCVETDTGYAGTSGYGSYESPFFTYLCLLFKILGSIIGRILGIIAIGIPIYICYESLIKELKAGPNTDNYNAAMVMLSALIAGAFFGSLCYNKKEKFNSNISNIYWPSSILVSIIAIVYCIFFEDSSFGIFRTIIAPTMVMMILNLPVAFITTIINKLFKG